MTSTTETVLNAMIAQRSYQAVKLWRACAKRGHSAYDRWVIYTAHEDIARWSRQRESLVRTKCRRTDGGKAA